MANKPIVTVVGDWQNLEEDGSHQVRFAKADGKIVGAVLKHRVKGTSRAKEVWCDMGMVQWEPWFGYRPLFTVTSAPGQQISLSPAIVCEICGDKGEIQHGAWRTLTGEPSELAGASLRTLDGEEGNGEETTSYSAAIRRDLGDKVPEEEEGADNKLVDLFPSAGVDPDLAAILAEEDRLTRKDRIDEVFAEGFSKESPRKELLDRVATYILGDRNIQYGPPHIDFQRTAEMLTALWKWKLAPGAVIEAHDIANVVTLIKLSRIQWSPEKMDNWDDGAGYFACGWEAYVETHLKDGQ